MKIKIIPDRGPNRTYTLNEEMCEVLAAGGMIRIVMAHPDEHFVVDTAFFRNDKCGGCKGRGYSGDPRITCHICGGTGKDKYA